MRRDCPREEAEHRLGLEVLYLPLPRETGGAALRTIGDQAWIIIDPTLTLAEQRCRLAHEIVHLDRGSSLRCRWGPRSFDSCVAQEELHVDREVADWLVPQRELEPLVRQLVRSGCGVDANIVCEEFLVTRPVAKVALAGLQPERVAVGF